MGVTMLDRYAAWVVQRRWPVWAVSALVMLAATAGVPGIGVTNDHRVLFDEHDPELQALEALDETDTESNNALIAIAPTTGTVFTRATLGLVELSRRLRDNWSLQFETVLLPNVGEADLPHAMRHDGFIELDLVYSF